MRGKVIAGLLASALITPAITSADSTRTLEIALGYEGRTPESFRLKLDKANQRLAERGILLELKETKEFDLPKEFNIRDLCNSTQDSFSQEFDHHYVWTEKDFGSDELPIHAYSLPGSRVTLLDRSMDEELIDELIEKETLRSLSKKTQDITPDLEKILSYEPKKIKKNKIFNKEIYVIPEDISPERWLTMNVYLDEFSKEDAKEIIGLTDEMYKKRYGISLNVIEFKEVTIPKSWDTKKLMKEYRDSSKNKSDIYIMITGRDWNVPGDEGSINTKGTAYTEDGFFWIEADRADSCSKQAFIHELNHLFQATHVYNHDKMMHPFMNCNLYDYTEHTDYQILKNKNMSWKWSNK